MTTNIDASTRLAVVLGDPVEHSLSPALHNAAFVQAKVNAVFIALCVSRGELPVAVQGLSAVGAVGASVTVPHKQAVMDLCTKIFSPADRIGAVNCLCFSSQGEIYGYNTDAQGYVDALHAEIGINLRGCRVVLLGAGGAARAVYAGLQAEDVGSMEVIARTPGRAAWVPGKARGWTKQELDVCLPKCDLLVDCTSAALEAGQERDVPAAVPIATLPDHAVVSSLIYHRVPRLLVQATARSLRTIDGKGMLIHQAARAFQLWTNVKAPIEAMQQAMKQATG